MANPSVCLSVVCDVRAPNLSTKNHEDRLRGSPPSEQISLTGVWLCDSSKVAKPP